MGIAAWDTLSIYISYNVLYVLRLGQWEGLSAGLAVTVSVWLTASYLAGRYSPAESKSSSPLLVELTKTGVAASIVLAVFVSHSWIYQIADAQTRFRGFLIPFIVATCCLSTLGQFVRKAIATASRNWIILCSKHEAQTIHRELEGDVTGLQARTRTFTGKDLPIEAESGLGSISIAVGNLAKDPIRDTEKVLRLKERGENIIPLINWCEEELHRIPPELVETDWLIQSEGFALKPRSMNWRIKRFGDVLGAAVLIIVTAPVLAAGGILIWLEDRGPIFYRQTRSGLYGRKFKIWKLRSMRVNAEQTGPQWASREDPRVTRVGRLMRSTRIDELPQLFSVLNGDLSLIGPRPERPEIEERLERLIPNYRLRHWIRPGLSGWAQVCYPYGASIEDSRSKLSYDLYYLRNAGITLDILIAIKTIRLLSGAKGAVPSSEANTSKFPE